MKFILLILLFFSINPVQGQKARTRNIQSLGCSAGIKHIVSYEISIRGYGSPEEVKIDTVRQIMDFDTSGNMISESIITKRGSWGVKLFTYDENGNMLSDIRKRTDGTIVHDRKYEFDTAGHLIISDNAGRESKFVRRRLYEYKDGFLMGEFKQTLIDGIPSAEPVYVFKYEYGLNGLEKNRMKPNKKRADSSDSTSGKSFILDRKELYDERGNVIETISYYNSGDTSSRETFTFYNDSLIERKEFSSGNDLRKTETFIFDENMNLVEKLEAYRMEEPFKTTFIYENSRLVEKRSIGSDGQIYGRTRFEYNENGDLSKKRDFINGALVGEITYSFDLRGNRVKMTKHSAGNLIRTVILELDYYD